MYLNFSLKVHWAIVLVEEYIYLLSGPSRTFPNRAAGFFVECHLALRSAALRNSMHPPLIRAMWTLLSAFKRSEGDGGARGHPHVDVGSGSALFL